jgi:hypothetical protein
MIQIIKKQPESDHDSNLIRAESCRITIRRTLLPILLVANALRFANFVFDYVWPKLSDQSQDSPPTTGQP